MPGHWPHSKSPAKEHSVLAVITNGVNVYDVSAICKEHPVIVYTHFETIVGSSNSRSTRPKRTNAAAKYDGRVVNDNNAHRIQCTYSCPYVVQHGANSVGASDGEVIR